ncbi:RHS repeat domain-containing protein [Paenirhodobacter sp.]|uniref:RHS repeat domain-containing protein n=1 Tax=Paenirhodobacter sp. TaxID=1965326 RepID=UPI003B5035D4
MTYDGENRPLSVTVNGQRTCYVYGVDGVRLKKVEGLAANQNCAALPANAGATVYFGDVEIRNWGLVGQETVTTYPDPVVKLTNGNQPAQASYLHRDHLGSVRAITDPAGTKAESAVYRPFGEQTNWRAAAVTEPESKGWIGERYDTDAGLQYLNARYYDPELSLFLQPDWFDIMKPGVGTNRYAYSFNDPVNLRDPKGNWFVADDVFAGPVDEIAVLGGLALAAYLGSEWAEKHLSSLTSAVGLKSLEFGEVSKSISSGNSELDGVFGGFDKSLEPKGQSYAGIIDELHGKLSGLAGAAVEPRPDGGATISLPDGTKISTYPERTSTGKPGYEITKPGERKSSIKGSIEGKKKSDSQNENSSDSEVSDDD